MKRSLRIILALAFAANLAAALVLVGPGLLSTPTGAAPAEKVRAETAAAEPTPVDAIETAVAETEPAASAESMPEPLSEAPAPAIEPIATNDAFARLKRAYENMEPETAARAVRELAARDREAVVALLLGFNARTAGAILDGLTESDPALAADLSYEIWKRSGHPSPPATAQNGR